MALLPSQLKKTRVLVESKLSLKLHNARPYVSAKTNAVSGTSRTTVERALCPGCTGSQQAFVNLRQPIDKTEYPAPRVLEAGRSYRYPFTFVVIDHFLPQVYTHAKNYAHIERSHTLLPPTLGDPILASNSKTILDDMAPDMAQIAYIIRVSVLKKQQNGNTLKSLGTVAKINSVSHS
jgi:hypothetical protein